jgi:hypothetical protein
MADAGTVTVTEVLVTLLGVRVVPPKLTVAPATNFVPVIASWNGPPPAAAEFGLRLVMAGSGLLTAKDNAFEVPPPGVGFVTVTFRGPGVLKADPGTVTVICVEPTLLGVRAEPPKLTVAPLTKFAPLMTN